MYGMHYTIAMHSFNLAIDQGTLIGRPCVGRTWAAHRVTVTDQPDLTPATVSRIVDATPAG